MERRQFFPLVVLGTTTLLTGNFLTSCSKDDDEDADPSGNPSGAKTVTIDLNDPAYATLKTPGNAVIKDNILILQTGDGTYQALSKVCTHQSCTVGFNGTEVVCPCHGSRFSTSGAVINGPATVALKKYTTGISGNILTITL